MNTLTPSEQEIVSKAASKYAEGFSIHPGDEPQMCIEIAFKRGADFAMSDLFKARMIKFVDWIDQHYMQSRVLNDRWEDLATRESYTAEQLYSKYMDYLKQKESNSTE